MKVSLSHIATEALKDLARISQTVYKLTGEEEWKDRSECYETELLAREVESACLLNNSPRFKNGTSLNLAGQ